MAVSPEKYQRGRVTWRKDYASDLWSVRVAPEERIEFQPGQYVTLGLEDHGAGKMLERAYSVCSAPHEEELEFFFELVPHGLLTPRLYELKPGADVWMRHRAKGTFTLDGKSGRRNHFMVTTVTGVAPAVSMVRAEWRWSTSTVSAPLAASTNSATPPRASERESASWRSIAGPSEP